MVNENFNKFNKVQQEHKGKYVGIGQTAKNGVNDKEYNNRRNTDKSVGATGRDL